MKTILSIVAILALMQGVVWADSDAAVYAFDATYAAQNDGNCIAMNQGVQAGAPFLLAHEPLLEAMIKASLLCAAAVKRETHNRAIYAIPLQMWIGSCAMERKTYPYQYQAMNGDYWCKI